MKFLAALQFLTVIPVPRMRKASPEQLGCSTYFFPVIGLIIGLILTGLNGLFGLFLPPLVVNALLITSLAAITGALHLDGLADTCDGMASHRTVEERWQIMRDSQAGSFGIVGIVLLLLVKYASLNSIPAPLLMATLIFMPIVSRWAMVYAIFTYPYARPSGSGTAFKQGTKWTGFTVATLITFAVGAVLIPLFQLTGLLLIFVIWVITAAVATYLKHKFSGLTGDTYGAINEVAEMSVLIMVILLNHLGLA